jgi:hypothetical protein
MRVAQRNLDHCLWIHALKKSYYPKLTAAAPCRIKCRNNPIPLPTKDTLKLHPPIKILQPQGKIHICCF